MYGNDNAPDPAGRTGGSEPAWEFRAGGEIVPREQHEGIDVPIPGSVLPPAPLPVPYEQPGQPPARPQVQVRRRTLGTMVTVIAVLLALVVYMLYATVLKGPDTVSASATSTSSASATASGTRPSESSPSGGTPAAGPSATDGASADATSTASATNGVAPGVAFSPVFGSQFLTSPVDNSDDVSTQVDLHISDVDYPHSVELSCPTGGIDDWNVAGYSTFSAMFGIPDDAQNATGVTDTITFTDQNGRTLGTATASIGQPAKVSLSFTGVDRLVINCSRQGGDAQYANHNAVALGDASVTTS